MAEDGNQGSVASGQNKAHDGHVLFKPVKKRGQKLESLGAVRSPNPDKKRGFSDRDGAEPVDHFG